MKVVRDPRYVLGIGANVEDEDILAALMARRRWVETVQTCPEGTLYRVIAYIWPLLDAERPIFGEDEFGIPIHACLLEAQYLVPRDHPDEAHVLYAYEADERGF